jgi:hypothetical protein
MACKIITALRLIVGRFILWLIYPAQEEHLGPYAEKIRKARELFD